MMTPEPSKVARTMSGEEAQHVLATIVRNWLRLRRFDEPNLHSAKLVTAVAAAVIETVTVIASERTEHRAAMAAFDDARNYVMDAANTNGWWELVVSPDNPASVTPWISPLLDATGPVPAMTVFANAVMCLVNLARRMPMPGADASRGDPLGAAERDMLMGALARLAALDTSKAYLLLRSSEEMARHVLFTSKVGLPLVPGEGAEDTRTVERIVAGSCADLAAVVAIEADIRSGIDAEFDAVMGGALMDVLIAVGPAMGRLSDGEDAETAARYLENVADAIVKRDVSGFCPEIPVSQVFSWVASDLMPGAAGRVCLAIGAVAQTLAGNSVMNNADWNAHANMARAQARLIHERKPVTISNTCDFVAERVTKTLDIIRTI